MMNFDQFPDHCRLWIYQSVHEFSIQQTEIISTILSDFIGRWQAHGQPLKAAFSIEGGHFILLTVDESYHTASGCSIDGSVEVMRKIEQATGLSLLDRSQVAIEQQGAIRFYGLSNLKSVVQSGEIRPDDLLIDLSIATLGEWRSNGKRQVAASWMKRYFSVQAA